jgi:hypothetical protein
MQKNPKNVTFWYFMGPEIHLNLPFCGMYDKKTKKGASIIGLTL